MNTDLETPILREPTQALACTECPLHLAMEQIARIAVRQHVLYLEGECQPRPELLEELDAWSSLHTLIRSRVCVASRVSPLAPDELEAVLAALPRQAEFAGYPGWQCLRASLTACAEATVCPLGINPAE